MGDCCVVGFVLAVRFLWSQILCRLYKSPSDVTINCGPPCVYARKKSHYMHVKDPEVHVRVLWFMETPK